jgi:hypothetical protein
LQPHELTEVLPLTGQMIKDWLGDSRLIEDHRPSYLDSGRRNLELEVIK